MTATSNVTAAGRQIHMDGRYARVIVLGIIGTKARSVKENSNEPGQAFVSGLDQRSSLNPGSTFGLSGVLATSQPVAYIHCAMRVSFG